MNPNATTDVLNRNLQELSPSKFLLGTPAGRAEVRKLVDHAIRQGWIKYGPPITVETHPPKSVD